MKSVSFKYDLGQFVTVIRTGLTGIITMCGIGGDPDAPNISYFINGVGASDWYLEKFIKEVD
jgi:hypothetical protein